MQFGDNIKIHIHVNNPTEVMDYIKTKGEIISMKVDDMKKQHRSQLFDDDELEC